MPTDFFQINFQYLLSWSSKSKPSSNALQAWLVLISFLHMVQVKKVYFPQLAAKITHQWCEGP
jgi:hypothetical protein